MISSYQKQNKISNKIADTQIKCLLRRFILKIMLDLKAFIHRGKHFVFMKL